MHAARLPFLNYCNISLSDENVFGYFKTFFLNLQSPYFFLKNFQMKEIGRKKMTTVPNKEFGAIFLLRKSGHARSPSLRLIREDS